MNGKLAPNLNSPSEHSEIIVENSITVSVAKGNESICPLSNKECSSVEIVRGYSSDFSSASIRMEQYLSYPEQESQSCYHEMMPTTIDSTIIIVDDFAAECDFNVSYTGYKNAESPQMSTTQETSILVRS